ncbi:hypothetical protein [Carboxylicivirga sp. N1Y90]|uniref:hypothetical protein n=1 Tax=Carboxylicivirga fragile TaxID=3417571 RepID=UPI003D334300|nr:hypothetical protein [Marinilabiliaceae bacterium N1Y90]
MKSLIFVFCVMIALPSLLHGQGRINYYNITKENYDLIVSGKSGSNYELGSGLNFNEASSPISTPLKAFHIDPIEETGNKQIDLNSIVNSRFSFIETNTTEELSEMLHAYFKGSYGFTSAKASMKKAKKISKNSTSVFILIENTKTGKSISEKSLEWNEKPLSESKLISTDEERLRQFIADYGSHYIASIDYGFRIAIQGKIKSTNSQEIESFKLAVKSSFGNGSASGGISASNSKILKSSKVELRCEITAGDIKPIHSGIIDGFENIYAFLNKLKQDEIKIYYGPISCKVNSYWHTLLDYPKTRELFKTQAGDKAIAPYGVPKGTVLAWQPQMGLLEGQSIEEIVPNGWAVCDGSNGTPNLVGRFIMGTDTYSDTDVTGGTESHKHTGTTIRAGNRQRKGSSGRDASDRNHVHDLNINSTKHLPPYYKLIYIIKI